MGNTDIIVFGRKDSVPIKLNKFSEIGRKKK